MKITELLADSKQKSFNICLNHKGNYISVNDVFAQTFFLSSSNYKDNSFFETIPGDEFKIVKKTFEECVKHPPEIFSLLINHSINNATISIAWNFSATLIEDEYVLFANGKNVTTSKFEEHGEQDFSYSNNSIDPTLLRKIFNYSLDIICALDYEGRFVAINNKCWDLWGYEADELKGKNFQDLVHPEDVERTVAASLETKKGKDIDNFENRHIRKDGSVIHMIWTAKWSAEDNMMYCVARDGTRRKAYETAIKASEEKYKLLFYNNPHPMWIYEESSFLFLEVNDAAVKKYGYTREEFLSMTIKNIRPLEDVPKLINFRGERDRVSTYSNYWRHKKKNGEIIEVEITAFEMTYEGRKAKLVLSNDITKHLKAEKELIKSNERYYYATKASFDAIWDWDILTNELYWSESYEKLFGYVPTGNREPLSVWLQRVHPDDRERVEHKFLTELNTDKDSWEDEYRFKKTDGSYAYVTDRGIIIRNAENKAYRMIGVIHDYTEKQKNEESLKALNASLSKRANELASSNQELERFAYVASHDLQEPLRMVSSFLQLLQRKYKAQLDEKANEYIHFAVDGADRMKVLILDLLKYSRVNTMKEAHELVDLNEVCKNILLTYKTAAAETNATIEFEELPTVLGTRTQLVQLLQNLVGNALKYRSEKPPQVKVSSSEDTEFWRFKVEDNGMGIDPRFYEKIFVIFQRLHHKDEYSGTGIGLAICKKIVERHGGSIWVESIKGEGSTFHFTLKKNLQNQ